MAKGMYVGQSINVGSVYILEYVENTSKSVKFDIMDRNPFPVVVWDNSSLTDAGKIKLKTSESNSYNSIQSLNKGNTIGEVGQYLYSPAAFDNSDTTVKYIYCIISGVTNKDTLTFDFELKKYKVASEVAETKQVARKVKKMYVGSPASAYTAASIRLKNPQNVEKEIVIRDALPSYYWSALSNGQLVKTDRQRFFGSDLASNITMLNGKYVLFDVDPDHIYYVQSTTDAPSPQAGDITVDPEITIAITGTMYDIEAGVARKVKKGYVGIGGVARPFFGGGIPTYYGRATDISAERFNMSGVSIGEKAIFAGGCRSVSYAADTASNSIDIYDSKLVHTTSTLTAARHRMAACSMGDWAIFAGGKTAADNKTTCTNTVYKINSAMTKSTASTGLATSVYSAAAAGAGNYAIVAGGRTGTSSSAVRAEVFAYNSALTRTQPDSLSLRRGRLSGCSLGDLAIFAGGDAEAVPNAYNSSLTRTASTTTFYYLRHMGTAVLNNKAIFAGGCDRDGSGKNQVYMFDSSLTRTQAAQSLNKGRPAAGVTMDGYAIFGGGYYGTTAGAWQCDIYDESMTRTNPSDDMGKVGISSSEYTVAGAKAGDYAVFAGDYYTWARAFVQA